MLHSLQQMLSPCRQVSGVQPFTELLHHDLGADGASLYFAPQSGRHLFRVPTSFLQSQPSATNPNAIILANQAVQQLGDVGSHLDGLETDDQGYIYLTAPGAFLIVLVEGGCSDTAQYDVEHNAINRFNPNTGMIEPFVRSPFIQVGEFIEQLSDDIRLNAVICSGLTPFPSRP